MERRHQIFISSTFADLIDERAEIIQALLELDCMPAGMEMFPATNAAAWDLIKGVIDDSDYYCLVIGGRYGSVDTDGVGFTEKEYDYAVRSGKPLIAFLHKKPGEIPSSRSEQAEEGRQKLAVFRKKVEAVHHCKYWSSPEELGGQVSRGLISLRKTHPSEGWVPGAYAMDESTRVELATLRARVAELESEISLKNSEKSNHPIADVLSSGADRYQPAISCQTEKGGEREWVQVSVSWDKILKYVGPSLLGECNDEVLMEKCKLCFYHALQELSESGDVEYSSIVVPHLVNDQIKVQLRALGQMEPGTRRRTVSDKRIYWKITQAGEERLLRVQAIAKSQINSGFGSTIIDEGGNKPMTDITEPHEF